MQDMTHADKIEHIRRQLNQIAKDAQQLNPQDIDELILEVDSLANTTGNRIYCQDWDDTYNRQDIENPHTEALIA